MDKILFIAQLPPPFHGASYLNLTSHKAISKHSQLDTINISASKNLSELGKLTPGKVAANTKLILKILWLCLTQNYKSAYFTPNLNGFSFFRDSIISAILKIRIKTVYLHCHGLGVKKNLGRPFYKSFLKVLFKDTIAIHVSKTVMEDEFRHIYGILRGWDFVTNSSEGIDEDKLKPRVAMNGHKNQLIISYVANFRESKGTLDALKIAAYLVKNGVNVKIDMVGDFRSEIFKEKCEDYIKTNHLENHTVFHGTLSGEDKFLVMAGSDLFIYPTYEDSFGLVMTEALSCGVPVFSYREGSSPEIVINGSTGQLFEKGEWQLIAEKILSLHQSGYDFSTLSDACRKHYIENFTTSSYEKKLIDIIFSDLALIMEKK